MDAAAQQAQAAAAELLKRRGDTEAAALKEVLRAQRKRINATVRQRNRDLAKLDRQAAAADPTALIPGLEEQLEVPPLDLQKLTSQERKQLAFRNTGSGAWTRLRLSWPPNRSGFTRATG